MSDTTTPKRNEAVARYEAQLNYPNGGMVATAQGEWVRYTDYAALQKDLDKLRAEWQASLGVGDGTGQLIVHGTYDSIKACQARLLEVSALQGEVSRLRDELALAYEAGWHAAAHWAARPDLHHDVGSKAYTDQRDAALATLQTHTWNRVEIDNLEPPTDGR